MATATTETTKSTPSATLSTLIEAGVHFGHRASRWNPQMGPFIHSKRNLIHIIDLRETLRGLFRATHFCQRLSAEGGEFVFVGTKRQARTPVKKYASACNMHWVSERWLGGTLTNFQTVMSRIQRLDELEALLAEGSAEQYSKKMLSALRREYKKIFRNLEGLRAMTKLPEAVILVDPGHEHICIREAKKLGIPVIAIVDTDGDPAEADIVIPGNDDAFRSIDVLLRQLTDAILRGRKVFKETLLKQREIEAQKKREEAERQRKIREAREAAAAERKKIEEDNAAKIAEARAKHLAEKAAREEGAPAESPSEAESKG